MSKRVTLEFKDGNITRIYTMDVRLAELIKNVGSKIVEMLRTELKDTLLLRCVGREWFCDGVTGVSINTRMREPAPVVNEYLFSITPKSHLYLRIIEFIYSAILHVGRLRGMPLTYNNILEVMYHIMQRDPERAARYITYFGLAFSKSAREFGRELETARRYLEEFLKEAAAVFPHKREKIEQYIQTVQSGMPLTRAEATFRRREAQPEAAAARRRRRRTGI
ncbi:MAG: hypothetical protein ACK4SY_07145 [Pyrobaculum sp.]